MPKLTITDDDFNLSRYPAVLQSYTKNITDKLRSVRVGDKGGLTQFGANKVVLPPQSATALRHWHENEDELVIVISGVATLLDDDGAHEMRAGECATFPGGKDDGHCIVNYSDEDVVLFEIGTRSPVEICHYPGKNLQVKIDRTVTPTRYVFSTNTGDIVYDSGA